MSLPDFPVSLTFPLRWGDMDALGHINNTVYFAYFEDVRLKYLEQIGFTAITAGTRMGAVLAQIECQFMRALEYPDTVTVGCRVERVGNTSLTMVYEIYSAKLATIAARGTSVVVFLNNVTNEKIRIPEDFREQILNLEGWA